MAILEQCPAQSFEAGIASLFKPPGLIEGSRGVGDDMEFIKGDARPGQVVGDTPDEGRRHVDAHCGDLLGPRFVSGQVFGKAGDGRGVPPFGHEPHLAFVGIGGNGQIIVAVPAGGLVDCHCDHFREVDLDHGEIDIARTEPSTRFLIAGRRDAGQTDTLHVSGDPHPSGFSRITLS